MSVMRLLYSSMVIVSALHGWVGIGSQQLVIAALERTAQNVHYDGRYFSIAYPNGDIPAIW